MGDLFRVTGIFCVAGNPTKAWSGSTGEDDVEHVPDDVWQDQVHPFGADLDAAKAFVLGANPQMSTHLAIEHSSDDGATWALLVYRDSDADHVEAAEPGWVPPSQRTSRRIGDPEVDESLAPFPAQEDAR